ncbi:MAG: hypothetical protein RL304_1090, partial [Verrucomicrobiota bacterium]
VLGAKGLPDDVGLFDLVDRERAYGGGGGGAKGATSGS